MGVPCRCFGCQFYEGQPGLDPGLVFCSLNGSSRNKWQVQNGVTGCSSFSPDQSASCTDCHYSSMRPPICSKNMTTLAKGRIDGYCMGYAKENYWHNDDFK